MRTFSKYRLINQLGQKSKNATLISLAESRSIAQKNPGPGIPLSMLPLDIQQRLQMGNSVTTEELEKEITAIKSRLAL